MSNFIHVKKIEMVRVEELSPLKIISKTSCMLSREVNFEDIDIQELVGVSIEDSYENNQKVYTTTATFSSKRKKPFVVRGVAFRLTSVNGDRFMIGTKERPFPIIKEKNPFPEKVPDTSLKTATITWKSTLPMLHIIE